MILRQVNEIDFKLFYAGKICCDELQRIKRIARQDCVKLPHFLRDIVTYKKTLNEIALANGLIQKINRPLSSGNTTRPKGRKKKSKVAPLDRVPSRALSCPSRTHNGVQSSVARPLRILSRRSSTYRRLCTSVASFAPLLPQAYLVGRKQLVNSALCLWSCCRSSIVCRVILQSAACSVKNV